MWREGRGGGVEGKESKQERERVKVRIVKIGGISTCESGEAVTKELTLN